MKKVMKKIVLVVLGGLMLLQSSRMCLAEKFNPATDWAAEAVFGVDGPAPRISLEPENQNWDEYINNFDIEAAVDAAYRSGAKYYQLNTMTPYGNVVAPNEVLDNYLGSVPGQVCATRDLIEDAWQECNKRGMKLFLYLVNDGIYRLDRFGGLDAVSFHQGMDSYIDKWSKVVGHWMERYGEKISGIWWDGTYDYLGFNEYYLQILADTVKKYSPECLLVLSAQGPGDGYGEFGGSWGIADATGGETYGLGYLNDGPWINEVRWHRYMPLYEYTSPWSSVAVDDLTDYMKKVREQGGFITFGVGNVHTAEQISELQVDLLSKVRKGLEDENYINSHKSGGIINATDCNRMSQSFKNFPNQNVMPILKLDDKGRRYVEFQTKTEFMTDGYWLNGNMFADTKYQALHFTFEHLNINPEHNYLTVCYKKRTQDEGFDFINRLEIKFDGFDSEAVGTINDVESVAWFSLSDNFVDGEKPEGFELAYFKINPMEGEHTLHFMDVLREDASNGISASQYRKFQDISYIPKEAVRSTSKIYTDTNQIGNFDHGDMLAFAGIDFEDGYEEMVLEYGVHPDYANRTIHVYADYPDERGTYLTSWKTKSTGGFDDFGVIKVDIPKLTGIHDIIFVGEGSEGVADMLGLYFNRVKDYTTEFEMLKFYGVLNETVKTNDGVTREEAVTAVAKLFAYDKGYIDEAEVSNILSAYSDAANISIENRKCVAICIKNEILKGTGDNVLGLSDKVTAVQIAEFLKRALVKENYVYADYSSGKDLLLQAGELDSELFENISGREVLVNDMVILINAVLNIDLGNGVTLQGRHKTAEGNKIVSGRYLRFVNADFKSENMLLDENALMGTGKSNVVFRNVNIVGKVEKIQLEMSYENKPTEGEEIAVDAKPAHVVIRLDSENGKVLAEFDCALNSTDRRYPEINVDFSGISGLHDVYFEIEGEGNYKILSLAFGG